MSFTESSIRQHLTCKNITIETHESITSTNTILKQRGYQGAPEGLVIAAEMQTDGRGRMGRSFFSPEKTGVYFSVLLRPTLSPSDSLLITSLAAVACARVLERISEKSASIKWVNDIYIDDKKVCGILTEASFSSRNRLDFAVLGIGINLTPPNDGFPADINDKAGSIFHHIDSDIRGLIIAMILNEFFQMYETIEKREFIEEYRSRSMLDGKQINIIKPDNITPATALYIDSDLSLVVQHPDGSIERLSSGDVSIVKQ